MVSPEKLWEIKEKGEIVVLNFIDNETKPPTKERLWTNKEELKDLFELLKQYLDAPAS